MDLSKAFYTDGSISKPVKVCFLVQLETSMDSDILQEHIYSVSELNDEVASLLGINFGIVWIEGESSNYMKSAAGHSYRRVFATISLALRPLHIGIQKTKIPEMIGYLVIPYSF